eukprot:25795-Eustigmatos_ZCMA.PRE.1
MGSLSDDYQPFMNAGGSGGSGAARHPWLGDVTQEADEPGSKSGTYVVPNNAANPHWNRIRFVEGEA